MSPPVPIWPQFPHLGRGEGQESAHLVGPSHSDVLDLKKKPTGLGLGGHSGHVAVVTGAQGCPGRSGLASCPEAALVTLDTRAGGGNREQGMARSEHLLLVLWKVLEGVSTSYPTG